MEDGEGALLPVDIETDAPETLIRLHVARRRLHLHFVLLRKLLHLRRETQGGVRREVTEAGEGLALRRCEGAGRVGAKEVVLLPAKALEIVHRKAPGETVIAHPTPVYSDRGPRPAAGLRLAIRPAIPFAPVGDFRRARGDPLGRGTGGPWHRPGSPARRQPSPSRLPRPRHRHLARVWPPRRLGRAQHSASPQPRGASPPGLV